MITSVFLVFILILLAVGLVATGIAAWRKALFGPEIAIVVVTITLLLWLLIGSNLPLSFSLLKWSVGRSETGWSFLVDAVTWRTTLFLLLLCEAVLLVARPQLRPTSPDPKRSRAQWLILPSLLLLVLTSLLAIWANTLAGLAISWSIMAISWFVFVLIAGWPITNSRGVLIYGGTLLIGVGLLWVAEAAVPGSLSEIADSEKGSEQAIIWTSLAAMVFLGAFPFQWWRSIDQCGVFSISSTVIFHLVPSIVGGSLLARMASGDVTSTGYLLFMTGFGLIGYLIGISKAWIHLGKPREALSGLIMAAAGMVLLVGVWADTPAVVAQLGVFTLSMAALYLVAEKSQWRFNWPIFIPIAASIGIPITIGFHGLAGLYSSWLDHGLLTLMLVTVFLSIPFIAVAILAWRSVDPLTRTDPYHRSQFILDSGGMALLSLGLLSLLPFSLASNDFLVWLGIAFAGVGGLTLAWFAGRGSLVQADLRDALRLNVPSNQIHRLFEDVVTAISLVIREAATIVEGEGGMLWVLVLIIVMWLARRG